MFCGEVIEIVSLCSPGWSGTVLTSSLKLTEVHLPLSPVSWDLSAQDTTSGQITKQCYRSYSLMTMDRCAHMYASDT